MSARVLLTGHCGYIGSALMETLLLSSYVTHIKGYDIAEGDDILDYDKLVSVLRRHHINLVIHLAAMASITACNQDPLESIRINGKGTDILLWAMKAAGCRNIIYASTSSVYGEQQILPYHEDMRLNLRSAYGASKLLGEHAIYNHYDVNGYDGNYIIFRMFNVVGTSGFRAVDKVASAGYDRLFAALESGSVTIYGNNYDTTDGTCERDYISLKDTCQAYVKAIDMMVRYNSIHEVINICSGDPLSVKNIILTWNALNHNGRLPTITYTYGPRREGDPAKVYGLNTKAFKLLKWKPLRKIENIIDDLAIDKKWK